MNNINNKIKLIDYRNKIMNKLREKDLFRIVEKEKLEIILNNRLKSEIRLFKLSGDLRIKIKNPYLGQIIQKVEKDINSLKTGKYPLSASLHYYDDGTGTAERSFYLVSEDAINPCKKFLLGIGVQSQSRNTESNPEIFEILYKNAENILGGLESHRLFS